MLQLRPPEETDAAAIQELLQQLGYFASITDVRMRLTHLSTSGSDPILLAVDAGEVLGLIALHWSPMLFAPARVARITTLVVNQRARGRGIGRALVEAGSNLARDAGCGTLELTTGLARTDAHAFYTSLGFSASSLRFFRDLA
ncbi:MAG: GNAT family N-acetyltransferase [Pseudomonas sp.]